MSDAKFFRAIEARGWMIEVADKDSSCIARCKEPGCSMRLRIKPGGVIPKREVDQRLSLDEVIESFDDARQVLRRRREQLGLSIEEVETAAGIATDQMLKFERDEPTRLPNIVTYLIWAQTLGYEVVLRPSTLPPITCRLIEETRDRYESRKRRAELLRQKRRRARR